MFTNVSDVRHRLLNRRHAGLARPEIRGTSSGCSRHPSRPCAAGVRRATGAREPAPQKQKLRQPRDHSSWLTEIDSIPSLSDCGNRRQSDVDIPRPLRHPHDLAREHHGARQALVDREEERPVEARPMPANRDRDVRAGGQGRARPRCPSDGKPRLQRETKHSHTCTRILDAGAVLCTSCGVIQPYPSQFASEKRIAPAALCFLFGVFGRTASTSARSARECCSDFRVSYRAVTEVEKTARGKHRWLVSRLQESTSSAALSITD
jgi:hypothetical protein